jgi:hypothetical protein
MEMNFLFGQQGSWKGTSKITMMAVFEERKKVHLEIKALPSIEMSMGVNLTMCEWLI